MIGIPVLVSGFIKISYSHFPKKLNFLTIYVMGDFLPANLNSSLIDGLSLKGRVPYWTPHVSDLLTITKSMREYYGGRQ